MDSMIKYGIKKGSVGIYEEDGKMRCQKIVDVKEFPTVMDSADVKLITMINGDVICSNRVEIIFDDGKRSH